MQTVEQIAGTQKDVTFLMRDGTGATIEGYTLSDTLTAAIWSGDDAGTLASPAIAWVGNRPQDGKVRITVTADDTAALVPAVYRLMAFVQRGQVKRPIAQFYLRIRPSPGAIGTPQLKVYGTYNDLTGIVANLDDLQADQSQAGLLEERETASRWFEEIVLSRARGEGDRKWLADRLAADGLVVDRRIREIVALRALSIAFQGRLSGKDGPEDPLPALGRTFARRASSAVASLVVRVAGDSAGTWHREINLSEVPTYRG